MKKTYMKPSATVALTHPLTMICSSQNITGKDGEITYGGVDEEGTKDPASRRHQSVWADDEEED